MTDAPQAAIYPRYCFHLSPTVNAWCLLKITDIHALKQHAGFEGENFYFRDNLPIKWVRIVGAVVAIDEFAGRRVYTVDDSSGLCIETTVFIQVSPAEKNNITSKNHLGNGATDAATNGADQSTVTSAAFENVSVGDIVDVKGSLSTFRDEVQIKIEKISPVKSTAQEIQLWEKRSRFRRDVLLKPWVLERKTIRRCRKEAENSDAELERKKKRLKPIAESKSKARPQESRAAVTKSSKAERDIKRPRRAESDHNLRDLIRQGALKGKYDALGL